jgi:hypothetical protein
LISGSFNMTSPIDDQLRSQGLDKIVDAIQKDRLSCFVRMPSGPWSLSHWLQRLYISRGWKNQVQYTCASCILLLLFDMWPVNKDFLAAVIFLQRRRIKNLLLTTADMVILRDKDTDFRVLNLQ